MADIAVTAAQVGVVNPAECEVHDFIAAAALTAGQAVYLDANGKVGVADANAAGAQQFRGLALKTVGAGQPVSVLKKGRVYGFTISGLAYNAPVYLSDTAGALADAAGTLTVNCGRVTALTDPDRTKVLYVEADWLRTWV